MILDRSLRPEITSDDQCISLSSSAARRAELDAKLAEYFARGGTVDEIPVGATATVIGGMNPGLERAHERNTRYTVDLDDVIAMLKRGMTSKQITEHYMQKMGCGRSTMATHIANARRKMRGGNA